MKQRGLLTGRTGTPGACPEYQQAGEGDPALVLHLHASFGRGESERKRLGSSRSRQRRPPADVMAGR